MQKKYLIHVLFYLFPIYLSAQTCDDSGIPENTPTAQFTDQGDGTVLDTVTNLIWKVCSEGLEWDSSGNCSGTSDTYNWQEALNAVETLNNSGGFVGQTDWRLPNPKEYFSIHDNHCYDPTINTDIFPNTESSFYWSSSPSSAFGYNAWVFDFEYGSVYYSYKHHTYPIRLVRTND